MIRVLIVEDERRIRNGIEKHIHWKSLGVDEIFSAESGEKALAVCRTSPPDLIISDICMPQMTGISLCQKVRETYPDTEIIFISGYSDKEYLMSAIELGVIGYVEKPIDLQCLESFISKAVSKIQKRQEEQSSAVSEQELAVFRSLLLETPDLSDQYAEILNNAASLDEVRDYVHNQILENSQSVEPPQKQDYRIKQVIDVIDQQLDNPVLSLQYLADTVYLTPAYLSALFKKNTGKTISQYISDCRVQHAKEYLSDPQYKLYHISRMVGYEDANYFAKIFKKQTGVTPSEYREKKLQ